MFYSILRSIFPRRLLNSAPLRRFLQACHLPRRPSELGLWRIRNRHKGERCVIIGMGPSLRIEDLERLKGTVTFACNKVFLAFPKTLWRPTYYTISDTLIAESCKQEIDAISAEKIFPDYTFAILKDVENILWIPSMQPSEYEPGDEIGFSSDLLEGIQPGGCTVVYDQIQIAYHMGFREVILIGVDFHYQSLVSTSEKGEQGEIVKAGAMSNYFIKNYCTPGERQNLPKLHEQMAAYRVARKVFEKSGRRLVNASRKTALTELETGSFDEFFPPNL